MIDPVTDLLRQPDSGGSGGPVPQGTSVIVTGQQPAVGGGPLYTLVKTAHAVALARQVAAAGRPCRAVHWIASEDHDAGEANHADLVGRDGRIRRVTADLGHGRAALRHRPAAAGWNDLLEDLEQHCGPGPGRDFLLRQAPLPEEGWGSWQGRWLRACFPDLITVEPQQLRMAGATSLRRVVAGWDGLRNALVDHGWEGFFGTPDAPPLFEDLPTGRRALTCPEALALLASAPERVSTGAGLRPLLQQATLPVLASIVGPGEAAYHRALGPIFTTAGIAAPRLVPRIQATLAPAWYLRACAAWQGDPATGLAPEPTPASRHEALMRLDALVEALDGNPDLAGHRRRIAAIGQRLERRLTPRPHAVPRGVLGAWARPRNQPQDRVMSCAQALWEWGPGVAELLVKTAEGTAPGVNALVRP